MFTTTQLLPGNIPTEPGLMRLQVTTTSSKWRWVLPLLLPQLLHTTLPLSFTASTCFV